MYCVTVLCTMALDPHFVHKLEVTTHALHAVEGSSLDVQLTPTKLFLVSRKALIHKDYSVDEGFRLPSAEHVLGACFFPNSDTITEEGGGSLDVLICEQEEQGLNASRFCVLFCIFPLALVVVVLQHGGAAGSGDVFVIVDL